MLGLAMMLPQQEPQESHQCHSDTLRLDSLYWKSEQEALMQSITAARDQLFSCVDSHDVFQQYSFQHIVNKKNAQSLHLLCDWFMAQHPHMQWSSLLPWRLKFSINKLYICKGL